MLKIAVAGATGRMGRLTIKEINQHPDCKLVGALTRSENLLVGQDAGTLAGEAPLTLEITDIPEIAFRDAQVIIDFSHPEGLVSHCAEALRQGKPYVICTTGFTSEQEKIIKEAALCIPLLITPNTSLGTALLKRLSRIATDALGPSYDISLLEMHHRHKADAPSGTTLSLAKTLNEAPLLYPSKSPRPDQIVECAVLRGGGVIGDHSVIFAGEKEMITLQHRVLDRSLFAQGALQAAQWLVRKGPGLYSMDDVLGMIP